MSGCECMNACSSLASEPTCQPHTQSSCCVFNLCLRLQLSISVSLSLRLPSPLSIVGTYRVS